MKVIRQLLQNARERKARIGLVVSMIRALSPDERDEVLAEIAADLEAEEKARQEKAGSGTMVPENRKLFLEFVNHEEYVEVGEQRGPSGESLGLKPIEGTRTAFLHLKAPDGRVIRAQIRHEDLDPVLAMVIPDYHPSQQY